MPLMNSAEGDCMARRTIRLETEDQRARRLSDESYEERLDLAKPTDTEILDWLESNAKRCGDGWICRNPVTGRGFILNETTNSGERQSVGYKIIHKTVREAIVDVMVKGI